MYIEGIPDQQLIQSLRPSLSRRNVIQAGTLSKVILKVASKVEVIGMIDEDPMKPRPTSFQSFKKEKNRKYEIEIYQHPTTKSRLIVLCPRLEEWIIYICKNA